jgi:peptidoglycan/xylan/chitin deacetylase (PgdA/CDA1 family)
MHPGLLIEDAIVGAAALALVASGWAYASIAPTSQLFGRTLIAGSDPSQIALTYDDGPNPSATPQLLELLARHNVRATFFLVGNFVRREPALAREIAAAGHLIGNHTTTHPHLALQNPVRVRQELADCNTLLEDTLGERVRIFRPPFGSRRPAVLRIARDLGLTPVLWNVTAYDWNPIGGERIYANLVKGIARNQHRRRASNLLLHDGSHLGLNADRSGSIIATQRLLETRANTPTRFVTVDAWL